ncbi:hypothetical protein N7528_000115 [Penicillium herquei]|nr:hypothetical protein N7528_000115 [Penicillium herquei]
MLIFSVYFHLTKCPEGHYFLFEVNDISLWWQYFTANLVSSLVRGLANLLCILGALTVSSRDDDCPRKWVATQYLGRIPPPCDLAALLVLFAQSVLSTP